jgi:hypothetical protein
MKGREDQEASSRKKRARETDDTEASGHKAKRARTETEITVGESILNVPASHDVLKDVISSQKEILEALEAKVNASHNALAEQRDNTKLKINLAQMQGYHANIQSTHLNLTADTKTIAIADKAHEDTLQTVATESASFVENAKDAYKALTITPQTGAVNTQHLDKKHMSAMIETLAAKTEELNAIVKGLRQKHTPQNAAQTDAKKEAETSRRGFKLGGGSNSS